MSIPTWFFPAVLIVADLGAALVWGFDGNWRQVVYWISAAALTTAVTF